MLWLDINKIIPSKFSLRLRWFFSFLPGVQSPPAFFWDMRSFLNNQKFKHTDAFPIAKLAELLTIFKSHPEFETIHLTLLSSLTKTQIDAITPEVLQTILALYKTDSTNALLKCILNRLNSTQHVNYLHYVVNGITKQNLTRKTSKTLAVLTPPTLSLASTNKLQWCLRFFSDATFAIRKSVLDILYKLPSDNCKKLADKLIKTDEVNQLYPQKAYEHVWKQSVLQDIQYYLVNKPAKLLKTKITYLQALDLTEQFSILKSALQVSEEASNTAYKFLKHYSLVNKIKLITLAFERYEMSKAAGNKDKILEAMLATLLSGKIDIIKPTQSTTLAALYFSDKPFQELTSTCLESLAQVQDDLASPLYSIPTKLHLFAINKLIDYHTNPIFESDEFQRLSKFSRAFVKLVQNDYVNRHRTPYDELNSIITTYQDDLKENQELLSHLQQMLSLYAIKEKSKLCDYEIKLQHELDKEQSLSIQLAEERRELYYCLYVGQIQSISWQRLGELFPTEIKTEEGQKWLFNRMRSFGCEVFNAQDKYETDAALKNHGFKL